MKFKAAYYGERGSYSEQAATQHFGQKAAMKSCKFVSEVLESVGRDSQFGVVPIENSIEGAVTQTYDLLFNSKLVIVGEEIVKISHCLMALRGVKLSGIRKVYSHPQALGQCRKYIESHNLDTIPFYDTAGSAKMLKESGMRDSAVIASLRAASIYEMDVLARDIQSNKCNYTRFLVIAKKPLPGPADKTSIAFGTKNRSGALFKALQSFANNSVNLLYIQSRPIPDKPWEYNFYIDCLGSAHERKVKKALSDLRSVSDYVKVLGSYKRARFEIRA